MEWESTRVEEARRELRTVRDLLRFGASRFAGAEIVCGHGIATPRDEAAYLLLHVLDVPEESLEEFLDATLVRSERDRILELFERRATERIPSAYLVEEAWLEERKFFVDPRVVIPRSFIAELLPEGLARWIPDAARVRRALDLCTGSGCLAILLAEAYPEASIDAADISPRALEVARRNVADHALEGRVRLVESDLLAAFDDSEYDLIVCNPPYVPAAAVATLPPEYRHEPRQGLDGGSDGLEIVRRVVAGAERRLAASGVLVVEVGHGAEMVRRAFPDCGVEWLPTSGGADAVFLIARGSRS